MKGIFYCLLFFLPALMLAQTKGSIQGFILDDQQKAIEFATVFVAPQNDSLKITAGTISDSTGKFVLLNLPYGDYVLHIQLIGYTKHRQLLHLDAQSQDQKLPSIVLLSDATLLDAVEVKGMRSMIKKTEEGIVVNAADNLTQIGGTAADLLKNTPSVLVGAEGEITLRGKSPLILLNGKISGISGTDRSVNLDQIPASSIDRIEIITNPSVKYDADAEGGIINIVLKKNTALGTNGAFALGAGLGSRYRLNGTLLLNHKTEKWNLGLAYDNWFTTRTRMVNGDRTQFDLPDQYFLTQRRFDEQTYQNQTARFNLDFSPNKKNSLSFQLSTLFQGEDNHETLKNTTQRANLDFTGRNRRYSNEIRRFWSNEATLSYTKHFDHPDQVLSFNASSAFNRDRENTDINTQTLSAQDGEIGNPFLQKTHTYQHSNLSNFSLDYTQPLNAQSMLETGAKSILRFLSSDFLRQNERLGNFVTDTANTDVFTFQEQIHAVYVQYSAWTGAKATPRFKYSLGLRAEQVWNEGNTTLKPLSFKIDYFNFFPSASLIYYNSRRDMLKLSYSRRINRPGFGQLNPFTDITDSLNQRSGNPYLRPELSHALELSYNQAFKKGNYTLSLFFRNTNQIILPYTILYNNGIAFTQPLNFGRANTLGFDGILVYNPYDFWSMNVNLSGYQLAIESNEATLDLQRQQFTWFGKWVNNFTLWPDAKLQITGNYTSPIAIPQGERVAVYFVDLGFQQKIMKGQGRLGLAFTDVFNTQQSGTRIEGDNFIFSRIFKLDTRAVMLTFGCTFKSAFKENLMENKFKNE